MMEWFCMQRIRKKTEEIWSHCTDMQVDRVCNVLKTHFNQPWGYKNLFHAQLSWKKFYSLGPDLAIFYKRGQLCDFPSAPFWKEAYSKMKEFAPMGNLLPPIRIKEKNSGKKSMQKGKNLLQEFAPMGNLLSSLRIKVYAKRKEFVPRTDFQKVDRRANSFLLV